MGTIPFKLTDVFLPVGHMLQLTDIVSIDGERIVCRQDLAKSDWLFQVHFPGDPIFPGSLMIEGAGQLVAVWMYASGYRGKPRLVKASGEFKSPLLPQDGSVTYTGTVQRRGKLCIGQVALTVGDRLVATSEIWLAVLG